MRTLHTRTGIGAPLRAPLSALTAMLLAGTAVILPQAAWADPGEDAPITVSAPGPSEASTQTPRGADAPSSTAEWEARNRGLADYARLGALLSSPEALNWVLAGDSITQGVWHSHGLARFADYVESSLHSEGSSAGPAPSTP